MIELDNTYRSAFVSCKRKYYLSRVLSLTPAQGSCAIRYGSTFHALLEGYYSWIKEKGWDQREEAIKQALSFGEAVWKNESSKKSFPEDDYRSLQSAFEAFIAYCTEYSFDKDILEVVETERAFKIKMEISPEEEKRFPLLKREEVYFTGILDMQVRMSELPYIMEHKTTGQSLTVQIGRLHRSPQILGYTYAGKEIPQLKAIGCIVNLHQISSRRKNDGTWGKLNISFQRSPEIFSDRDLRLWRESFLSTCNEILLCQETNNWPMQFDNCYSFGRCRYCDLCERNISLEELTTDVEQDILPEGYIKDRTNIFEVSTSGLIKEANNAVS